MFDGAGIGSVNACVRFLCMCTCGVRGVCVYVCVFVCVCIHVCVCIFLCAYACVSICVWCNVHGVVWLCVCMSRCM